MNRPWLRALLPLAVVLALGVIFNGGGAFFEWQTHRALLREISVHGILACGLTVVIVAGEDLPRTAASVINQIGPRLIALAGGEHAIDDTIDAVRDLLDDTGLMAMEPALALEI